MSNSMERPCVDVDFDRCPQCRELFFSPSVRTPMVGSCGHSICRVCLEQQLHAGRIDCPACLAVHSFDTNQLVPNDGLRRALIAIADFRYRFAAKVKQQVQNSQQGVGSRTTAATVATNTIQNSNININSATTGTPGYPTDTANMSSNNTLGSLIDVTGGGGEENSAGCHGPLQQQPMAVQQPLTQSGGGDTSTINNTNNTDFPQSLQPLQIWVTQLVYTCRQHIVQAKTQRNRYQEQLQRAQQSIAQLTGRVKALESQRNLVDATKTELREWYDRKKTQVEQMQAEYVRKLVEAQQTMAEAHEQLLTARQLELNQQQQKQQQEIFSMDFREFVEMSKDIEF